MTAKLTTSYSPLELQEILASLARIKLINQQDIESNSLFFNSLRVNFLSVNDILLPFIKKFVHHTQKEVDAYSYGGKILEFYRDQLVALIRASPLNSKSLDYSVELDDSGYVATFTVQVNREIAAFTFKSYSQFLSTSVNAVNELLAQHSIDLAYYLVSLEEDTLFLLLSSSEYTYLLENRLLNFSGVDYPEIAAWRQTLNLEDLPF